MCVVTGRTVHVADFVRLVFLYIFFIVAINAEGLRFRYKEELIPGTMGIMADPATPGAEGAMHKFLVHPKFMTSEAEFLYGRYQGISRAQVAGFAHLCLIGAVPVRGLCLPAGCPFVCRFLYLGDLFRLRFRHSIEEETEDPVSSCCFAA